MAVRTALTEACGPIERAVPVLFLPCVATTGAVFSDFARRTSEVGFRCCVVEDYPDASLDETIEAIRQAAASLLFVPPVIVTQGFGSSVAQKFIESHGARGLVCLSPAAPDCAAASAHLGLSSLEDMGEELGFPDELQVASTWMASDKASRDVVERVTAAVRSEGCNSQLLRQLADEPINLEPCPVPMLAIGSAGDRFLPVETNLSALAEYHQLDSDEVLVAGDGGACPPGHVLLAEDVEEVPEAILDFLLQR